MCRLLCVNKEGAEMLEETIGVRRMLNHLVKQCGGHGNGLALFKDGKITFVKKGINYSNKSIAKKILSSDFDYAMYHTRVASVGKVRDSNCHPYVTKNKDFLLMMNGTESAFSSFADEIGITDTELIFRIMGSNGVKPSALNKLTSRFMGFQDGKVFIKNSSFGGLEFIREKNAFVVASSFPNFVMSEDMAEGIWMQGETIKKKVWGATTYGNYSYSAAKTTKAVAPVTAISYKSDKDKEVQELRKMQEEDTAKSCTVNEDDYDNWEAYQTALSY